MASKNRLPSMTARAFAMVAAAAALVSSCAELNLPGLVGEVPLTPPSVTFTGATLVGAPPARALAAYYCPDVVQVPVGGALLCQQLFGPRPNPASLEVAFDVHFHVANPNRVPLPLASVLAAATVFPTTGNQKLGAVCVSLCPQGAPGCAGGAAPGACEASSRDVRSLNDFVNGALPRLIISNGVSLASGGGFSFTPPPIVSSSEVDVTARYAFGPEQLLGVMRELAAQSVSEIKAGRAPTFVIPYRVEGTIWFDGGSFGRLAVGWGPAQGTWTLPVGGLVPR